MKPTKTKIFALIFALIMTLALAACANADNNDSGGDNSAVPPTSETPGQAQQTPDNQNGESPDPVVIEEPVETPVETTQPEASGEWDPLAGREVPENLQRHVEMLIEHINYLCDQNGCTVDITQRHVDKALDAFLSNPNMSNEQRDARVDSAAGRIRDDHRFGR